MTKQETKAAAVTSDVEEQLAFGRDSLQTAMKSYSEWLQTASKAQTETLRFISERLRKDMEMPTRFATCKNPSDVLHEQMEFANTMMSDYAEEGQKIVGIWSDAAENVQFGLTSEKEN